MTLLIRPQLQFTLVVDLLRSKSYLKLTSLTTANFYKNVKSLKIYETNKEL